MKNKNKINEEVNPNAIPIELDAEKIDKIDKKMAAQLHKASEEGIVNVTIKDKKGLFNEDEVLEPEAIIEPKDQATIKYLSNVIDDKTGKISQPFTIADKNYQMIRGMHPNGEIAMAVYCLDDMDDIGNNVIHSIEEFEKNVVKPVMEIEKLGKQQVDEYDYAASEREYFNKENLIDFLNLRDLEGYKHFFVNINTGEIVGKFKNYKEMMRSGVKLGPEEDYMNIKQLKAFRAGEYFKEGFNKSNENGLDEDINIDKLKGDVKILINKMTKMFGKYFAKLNTPIEQSVFLAKMGQLVNVPVEKLPQIISTYKDLAKDDPSEAPLTGDKPQQTTESIVITKKKLIESVNKKRNVIKKIKVKDIK
jgi:hypothetical protein